MPSDESFATTFDGPWFSWIDNIDEVDRDWLASVTQLRASLRYILDHIAETGPYDVVYGFSQGAALVALLSGYDVLAEFGVDDIPWKPLIRYLLLWCWGIVDFTSGKAYVEHEERCGSTAKHQVYGTQLSFDRVTRSQENGSRILEHLV